MGMVQGPGLLANRSFLFAEPNYSADSEHAKMAVNHTRVVGTLKAVGIVCSAEARICLVQASDSAAPSGPACRARLPDCETAHSAYR